MGRFSQVIRWALWNYRVLPGRWEAGKAESERGDGKSGSQNEVIPGWGPWAKACGQPLGTRKGLDIGSHLQPPKRTEPCQYLDSSFLGSISNFWPPALWDNTFVLFWVPTFLVISDSSHRKLKPGYELKLQHEGNSKDFGAQE